MNVKLRTFLATLVAVQSMKCAAELTRLQEDAFDKYNVSVETNRDGRYVIEAGHLPPPDHGPFSPEIKPDVRKITINKKVDTLDKPGCINQGMVGVAVNGVPIHGPYDKDGKVFEHTKQGNCSGHIDPVTRGYFYVQVPNCLVDELEPTTANGRQFFMGKALDGYPIYTTSTGYMAGLDDCNFLNDAYYWTNEFPFGPGCYHGKILEVPPKDTHCVYATVSNSTGWDDPSLRKGNLQV